MNNFRFPGSQPTPPTNNFFSSLKIDEEFENLGGDINVLNLEL
jgi:hypothetical protein